MLWCKQSLDATSPFVFSIVHVTRSLALIDEPIVIGIDFTKAPIKITTSGLKKVNQIASSGVGTTSKGKAKLVSSRFFGISLNHILIDTNYSIDTLQNLKIMPLMINSRSIFQHEDLVARCRPVTLVGFPNLQRSLSTPVRVWEYAKILILMDLVEHWV
jgi:hypothetical protein